MKHIAVIFNGQVSADSMGGGDKIVMHCAANMLSQFKVAFFGCPEGQKMLKKNFGQIPFFLINTITTKKFGLVGAYVLRILLSPLILLVPKDVLPHNSIIWSASDFLPDSIPGWFFRVAHRRSRWVGNMFLLARDPFKGEIDLAVNTVLSFISQQITLALYKKFDAAVLVLCTSDRNSLLKMGFDEENVHVISGGIDLESIKKVSNPARKMYDACFVGRFHAQKGLDDLLNISQSVVSQKSNKKAVLAIIGWGSKDWTA